MKLLFLKQDKVFSYYDDMKTPEDTFPTHLVNLLDEWEDTINKRLTYKQYIFKEIKGVYFFKLNGKYHRIIRKEMLLFDEILRYEDKYRVFAGRLELLDK